MSEYEKKYDDVYDILKGLELNIKTAFENSSLKRVLYTTKSRIKEKTHLLEKIERKNRDGRGITAENLFNEITDIIGIRLIVLYPQHFKDIHDFIMKNVAANTWELKENPILYTWDDDMKRFFEREMNFENTSFKESLYTSVHYVLRIKNTESSVPYFEVQVRTLLEEVFGEIDHDVNYPHLSKNEILKSQLKALAKMMAGGVKLAETIYMQKEI